jgi:hypothetical protein
MDELLKQAPENIDENIIRELYEKNNRDYMKTLLELWDIKEVVKEPTEWDNIRETCDVFDGEMTRMMSNLRNSCK